MNKESPITVLMTVYNSEKFLAAAIESILKQSFKNFEFIIVDDASTDRTAQIISSFKDPRIVVIRNARNLGQTKSLNIGIRQSRGQYVARMDADDISEPQRLEVQYAYLESHPDVFVAGSWTQYIDEENRPFRLFKTPTDPLELKAFLSASGDLTYWCISHPTVMIRRQAFDEAGLYNEEKGEIQGYPQDYDLWARFFPKYKFANIPQVLLLYRILQSSDSRKFARKQLEYRLEITLRKIQSFLPGLEKEDQNVLAKMLEFHPQKTHLDGKRVLSLFDRYFDAVMKGEGNPSKADLLKNKMKLYYLSQLFRTNKILCWKEFISILGEYPQLFCDDKFYRKIGKAICYTE